VKLWETRGGKLLRTLEGHQNTVLSVAFDPQGGTLASGSRDQTVKLWETRSGKLLRTLEGHRGVVWSVAFDPQGGTLASGSSDGTVKLWETRSAELLRTVQGHRGVVWSVAFGPQGGTLASGSFDGTVKLWEARSGKLLRTLEGHGRDVWGVSFGPSGRDVWGVSFGPQGGTLASESYDNTVKLWETRSGKLLRTLEGHTTIVDVVAFSPDGRLLASKSADHTIRLWSCETWETVAVIPEPTHTSRWIPALAFHPKSPLLATAGLEQGTPGEERSRLIHLWELDLDVLLGRRGIRVEPGKRGTRRQAGRLPHAKRRAGSLPHSRRHAGSLPYADEHYRNAKVVLVGNTSVGKSGLGLVLAGRKFRATESSHGRHVWTMGESEWKLGSRPEDGYGDPDYVETRETLLWDLAGQPGYRLVHQLHLSEVAVALVLFDARSETEPFAGVSYWARALDAARGESFPLKKLLISARIDRSGPAVSRARIDQIVQRYGFDGYFETSAKRGDGVSQLRDALRKAIEWSDLPAVTRTSEFQITKAFLVARKRRGMIVEETDVLFRELLASCAKKGTGTDRPVRSQSPFSRITPDVFHTCLQQLETTGLIRRLTFGDWVLLQPELLDDYCGWLTQAARAEPDGLGFLWEDDARAGRFPMDDDRPLGTGRKKEEQTLLLAAVEESLSRGLAVREAAAQQHRSLLVFPAELRDDLPDYPGGYSLAMRFRFHGPVRGIYASLVVRLIYSMEFDKHALHRNAALFRATHDGDRICGLAVDYPDVEDDSLGRLTVFFDDNTRSGSKHLFLQYISSQLEAMAFGGSIERERVYHCGPCDLTIDPRAPRAARKKGNDFVTCSGCGARFPLDDLVEQSRQADARVKEIDRQAQTGQRLAGLVTTIAERRKDGAFDVFLCHNSQDKPAVRELAQELADMGLLAWIDEERLLPGDVVQEKLERAIQQAGAVIVCIGPHGLGRWQTVEYHSVYERLIDAAEREPDGGFRTSQHLRVIPVLLPGAQKEQIPLFLRRHLYVDLRRKAAGAQRGPMQKLVAAILGEAEAK
jgi:GTPase SAR1 family protein